MTRFVSQADRGRGRRRTAGASGGADLAGAGPWDRPADLRTQRQILLALITAAVLVAVGLILYQPLFSPTPVIDDSSVVFDNPAVRGTQPWFLAPFHAETYRPLWRPIATLTLRLNLAAVGADKPGLEIINLLLLVAACFTAFLLLRVLGQPSALPVAVAILLLIHPANSESVLRLAGRSELLASVLMLAALCIYIGGRAALSLKRGIALAALFVVALLSHEMALLLPVFIIGYELIPGRRAGATEVRARDGSRQSRIDERESQASAQAGAREILRSWTTPLLAVGFFVAVGIIWAAIRTNVLHHWPAALRLNPAQDYLAALSNSERVRVALALPVEYARMVAGQVLPDYAHLLSRPPEAPAVVLGDPRTFGVRIPGMESIVAGIVLLLIGFAVFVGFRRRRPLAAFGGWIVGTALLVSLPLLRSNGHVASARHLFFPLLGILMILADAALAVWRRIAEHWRAALAEEPWLRWILLVPVLALCVFWFASTKGAGAAWRTPDAVIARLEKAAPLSPEIPLQRAAQQLRRAQSARAAKDEESAAAAYDRAAEYYEEAIGLFPRMPRALLNLGLISAERQRTGLAGRALNDAALVSTQVNPGTALESRAYVALGTYQGEQGLDDAAQKSFEHAVVADSSNVQALVRAGLMEVMRTDAAPEGVRHLEEALRLDPQNRILGVLGDRAREVLPRAKRALEAAEVSRPDTTAAAAPAGDESFDTDPE